MQNRHERLAELAKLEKGWFGQGAGEVIKQKYINIAGQILSELELRCSDDRTKNPLNQPLIYPTIDGLIQFEWLDVAGWSVSAFIANVDTSIWTIDIVAIRYGSDDSFTDVCHDQIGLVNWLIHLRDTGKTDYGGPGVAGTNG